MFGVFQGPELRVECVLASAALPDLFRSVSVPRRGVVDYRPDELWVVQIDLLACMEVPTTVDAIADRRNGLAGNLSLEQELRFIETINELLRTGLLSNPRNDPGKYRPITVFRIPLQRDLSYVSKLDRSPAFLSQLMAHGEAEVKQFLVERRRRLRKARAEA